MQHLQPGPPLGASVMPPPMIPGLEPVPSLPSLLTMKVTPPDISMSELKLPQALEQALAFKTERAKMIGINEEDPGELDKTDDQILNIRSIEDDIEEPLAPIIRPADLQDKQKRRKKRKKKKRKVHIQNEKKGEVPMESDVEVEVEYIQEQLGLSILDPLYRQFAKIFETFRIAEVEKKVETREGDAKQSASENYKQKKSSAPAGEENEDDEDEKLPDDGKQKISKRKLKKLTRLSVAELKQLVNRPDVVEMHDVTARDPRLLVQLKAHRNTVPVPRHWCFKRKYLQGKRGIEKPPFDLPDFIKKTGIMEMRAALAEKEDQRTLKAKMRERARPKLGKIDIDYQKLHDAFFKWQTKPKMTIHGDLYYEGKEFETKLKEKKPGDLTDELRTALGMPVGPSSHKVPPPWLIAMQRYGPPPSYPNLKIPGLNAPIPEGCSFGYHAGGWGKPPVDELGKPLYGDVFGITGNKTEAEVDDEEMDRTMWGELESESEESEAEEEESEDEDEEVNKESGLVTPAEGLVTPSGMSSVAGLETPDVIQLRKKKIENEMEGSETPALYQVLPEKRVERIGGSMMGSTHVYDVGGAEAGQATGAGTGTAPRRTAPTGTGAGPATIELALDPSELDLVDTDAMAVRYEQQIRQQQSQLHKEDLTDMVVEHVSRQKSKRKRQQVQENKPVKKYKEFKF